MIQTSSNNLGTEQILALQDIYALLKNRKKEQIERAYFDKILFPNDSLYGRIEPKSVLLFQSNSSKEERRKEKGRRPQWQSLLVAWSGHANLPT